MDPILNCDDKWWLMPDGERWMDEDDDNDDEHAELMMNQF